MSIDKEEIEDEVEIKDVVWSKVTKSLKHANKK